MKKHRILSLIFFLSLSPIIAFAESLWDVAQPIDDLQYYLAGSSLSSAPVFYFTAPAEHDYATVNLKFCTASNCSANVNNYIKSYVDCTDATHAGNTYFFTSSTLYSILIAGGKNPNLVAGMKEYPGASSATPSAIGPAAGTCDTGAGTCSLTTPDSTHLVIGTSDPENPCS